MASLITWPSLFGWFVYFLFTLQTPGCVLVSIVTEVPTNGVLSRDGGVVAFTFPCLISVYPVPDGLLFQERKPWADPPHAPQGSRILN